MNHTVQLFGKAWSVRFAEVRQQSGRAHTITKTSRSEPRTEFPTPTCSAVEISEGYAPAFSWQIETRFLCSLAQPAVPSCAQLDAGYGLAEPVASNKDMCARE